MKRKSETNQTAKKSRSSIPRTVPNPVKLSEDEADAIIARRRLAKGETGITIEEYLAKHGVVLDRKSPARS